MKFLNNLLYTGSFPVAIPVLSPSMRIHHMG